MEAVWSAVKTALKEHIPDHSYRMWIEPIQYITSKEDHIVLSCPNSFYKKRVLDQYGEFIESEFSRSLNATCKLMIEVNPAKPILKKEKNNNTQLSLPHFAGQTYFGRQLKQEFTFDKFVVGGENDFAYSAALSLASKKISQQNSLLLLSKTGMGKSHLSQAVGHYILTEFPRDHVYYITAEDFMNEMVESFRNNAVDKWKKKYRDGCDVLLLEDVQYLSGKTRTQEELSLTLDFLFSINKKVIFSSCYLPQEIPKLDEKLKSHFTSGIITNIEPPCYRTRVRILQKKARIRGYNNIPEDVIEYLATELTEDVRQLESGLIGVATKSDLLGIPIDFKLAQSVVKNIACIRKSITIDVIKKVVCKHFGISIKEVESRSRKRCHSHPRQIAIYLARRYTDAPLQTIGRHFNRYHATVLHAVNCVDREVKVNGDVKRQVDFLCDRLDSGKF